MIKIIFDQGTPAPLRKHLTLYEVSTVYELGWSTLQNGNLINQSEKKGFDINLFTNHVKPMMCTLFYTGFRPGDVIGLRWEDVNLNFSTVSKVVEKTAHKKPENHTFPISKQLIYIFKKWHIQQGKPQTGLVFPSPVTGIKRACSIFCIHH